MDTATIIAILALLISVVVTLFTERQVSLLNRQLRLDSLIKISDSNREIISIGFERPELWKVFYDSSKNDNGHQTEEIKRYLQLWFNHMHIIWKAWSLGLLDKHEWAACRTDMLEFLAVDSLRQHWTDSSRFYPQPFQSFIDSLIASNETSKCA